MNPPVAATNFALDQARQVNAICDLFEADWRAGHAPRIEDFLGTGSDQEPPGLLVELLALEIELRNSRGDRPTLEEYLARFPDSSVVIQSALGALDPRSAAETIGYPANSTNLPSTSGQDFVDFELLEEVARGGMGIVFKARKRSLNCLVALKVMHTGKHASAQEKQRFLLEAEIAANLNHPHIVPVFEIDRIHGLFYSMKWVEGGSLAQQVARFRGDPVAAARLVATVAHAVQSVHAQGYLHRDLKPTNILLDGQGKPFLTDFGLALRVGVRSDLTQLGAVVGTPSYMAPEQAAGKGGVVGPPADVYSLGAVLYELLAGQPPFRADTVLETLVAVLEKDPVPPGWFGAAAPPELAAICLKCLEKDPTDRYPTAETLAEDLDRFLRGEGTTAIRAGVWLRLRRWTRQEPQLVARLLGLGVIEILTQCNFGLSYDRDLRLHLQVSITLLVWALVAIGLQALARRDRWRAGIRPVWSAADAGFLTLTLWFVEGVGSSMVVGYPLIVAASGLWFRVELVWLATGCAELGYGLLVADAWRSGTLWAQAHHPNVVIAAIAVAGFIVARQVKRFLVLSTYYENRRPD